jgi:hypothetical protein
MKTLGCALIALSLASCAQMNSLKTATVGGLSKVSDLSKASVAKLMPPKIPVVEVREKDLKAMPTGEERALAFEKSRQPSKSFWFFRGPVDFKEPELPESGAAIDGELLPPKME